MYGKRIAVGLEAREKGRVSMENGLMRSIGLEAGDSDHNGYSLLETARASLEYASQSSGGPVHEMLTRAMTTSDFPLILANTASKSLAEGFEAESETWKSWCSTGSVPNFRKATIVSLSGLDPLDEIKESMPYTYGTADESREEVQVATYGKIFAITRQTIINDDLSALRDIPYAHGEAAARKIGDLAYAQLTQNPTMGDGKTLFHASHGNILTPGVISETTLAEAIKLMRLQKDSKGRPLNIRPITIVAPVSLEGAAEIFFNSNQFTGTDVSSTRANIYGGPRFQRIYDARLDDASVTTWYVLAEPRRTVKLFFLNGQQEPFLDRQQGWDTDGVEYKVRIDCAAKALDWRGISRNTGA